MTNMKHIRKFNEDMDMESGLGFKLVGSLTEDEIEGDIRIGHSWSKLTDGSELKEGSDEAVVA